MTNREQMLLVALAKMVDQYLDSNESEVDSLSMSAGEHAILALAEIWPNGEHHPPLGAMDRQGQRIPCSNQTGH
jgi:hypothetical protein